MEITLEQIKIMVDKQKHELYRRGVDKEHCSELYYMQMTNLYEEVMRHVNIKKCGNCHYYGGNGMLGGCSAHVSDICQHNGFKTWKPLDYPNCNNCECVENNNRCKICKERELEYGLKYLQWSDVDKSNNPYYINKYY